MDSQDFFFEIKEPFHCLADLIEQVVTHYGKQPGVTIGILPTIQHVEDTHHELLTRGIKSQRIHSKVPDYDDDTDPNSTVAQISVKPKSIDERIKANDLDIVFICPQSIESKPKQLNPGTSRTRSVMLFLMQLHKQK